MAAGDMGVSDGLSCFNGFAEAGFETPPDQDRRQQEPAQAWANTTLGNIKAGVVGTRRALRPRHAGRYLAGFEWRFKPQGSPRPHRSFNPYPLFRTVEAAQS